LSVVLEEYQGKQYSISELAEEKKQFHKVLETFAKKADIDYEKRKRLKKGKGYNYLLESEGLASVKMGTKEAQTNTLLSKIAFCVNTPINRKIVGANYCECGFKRLVFTGCGHILCPICNQKRTSKIRKSMFAKIPQSCNAYYFITIRPTQELFDYISMTEFRKKVIESFKELLGANHKYAHGGIITTEYFPELSKFGVHYHGIVYLTRKGFYPYSRFFKILQRKLKYMRRRIPLDLIDVIHTRHKRLRYTSLNRIVAYCMKYMTKLNSYPTREQVQFYVKHCNGNNITYFGLANKGYIKRAIQNCKNKIDLAFLINYYAKILRIQNSSNCPECGEELEFIHYDRQEREFLEFGFDDLKESLEKLIEEFQQTVEFYQKGVG